MISAFLIAAAYLLGAVPFGLLVGFARGIDVRTVGSKNIGATNVLRSVGKPWGILTFVLDALKGFVPAFLFPVIGKCCIPDFQPLENLGLWCGTAAILGHNFPVYLGFKGGKGVATSAGALLGIAPLAALVGLGTWVVIFFTTRYVSLGSILAAATTCAAGWWFHLKNGLVVPIALTVLAILIIWRHRANIQRLIAGTEHRFEKKKKPADAGLETRD